MSINAQRLVHSSTKGLLQIMRTIVSRARGQRLRVDPVDLHRDHHRQDPLAVFVPHLDRDVTGFTLR
jgi:hypothetical protein